MNSLSFSLHSSYSFIKGKGENPPPTSLERYLVTFGGVTTFQFGSYYKTQRKCKQIEN